MPMESIAVFGVEIHAVSMVQAVDQILMWAATGDGCRVVVTPNLDHAVVFQRDERLRDAYRAADLVLADGQPLVLASRLSKRRLPERVAGSDLVPALFAATTRPLTVYLLGAAEGVAVRAKRTIEEQFPFVRVVGTYSPPPGFEAEAEQTAGILRRIEEAHPDVLILGLGAPKQEIWATRHKAQLAARVAICAGATIDFLAGERVRAPSWMRRSGLEWLYRVSREPGRLGRRYLRDALALPGLLWTEVRTRRLELPQ